jgi:CheY-like chemotaxis protein
MRPAMHVFISHAFENRPEFDNIAEALTQADVQYWNPADVKPGGSLRDQLRQAVEHCPVCIFVATHRSLASSWCGTELGAFWGAAKPVIVYVADSSLSDDQLPPVVQGDVWERRISRVVARAKELLSEASSRIAGTRSNSTSVGNMTVEQLEKVIASAVSLATATNKTEGKNATPAEINEAARDTVGRLLEGIRATERATERYDDPWQRRILWVDDRPSNNTYERSAFEAMNVEITLALSTNEALEILAKRQFAAIISDMGRPEGLRAGYALLESVRKKSLKTPFFIYAGENSPAHKQEAASRDAQGSTNDPQELFEMVVRVLAENSA